MTLTQAKENSNRAYRYWVAGGMREACDDLNNSNREIIKVYISEYPNAIGYKFHEGFVEVKNAETLYNFCCDYVFDGNSENMAKVEKLHKQYKNSGKIADLGNLQNALEEANGICLIWS